MGRFKDYLIETSEKLSNNAVDIAEAIILNGCNLDDLLDDFNISLTESLMQDFKSRIESAITEEIYKIAKQLIGGR